MNKAGKGIIAFFLGTGALMVLALAPYLEGKGGEAAEAAKVFDMIGKIWVAVALLLLALFVLIGSATRRSQLRSAEMIRRETSEGPDVPQS